MIRLGTAKNLGRKMKTKHANQDMLIEGFSWHDDMLFAFETAASGIEGWEYGGTDSKAAYERQNLAALEVAKRIRGMADRYARKHK